MFSYHPGCLDTPSAASTCPRPPTPCSPPTRATCSQSCSRSRPVGFGNTEHGGPGFVRSVHFPSELSFRLASSPRHHTTSPVAKHDHIEISIRDLNVNAARSQGHASTGQGSGKKRPPSPAPKRAWQTLLSSGYIPVPLRLKCLLRGRSNPGSSVS